MSVRCLAVPASVRALTCCCFLPSRSPFLAMSVQSVSPGFGQHTAARLGCWTVGAEGRMLVVQHPLRRALCQGHTWTQAQALLWDLALVKMDPLVLIWGGLGEGSKLNTGISGSSARGGEQTPGLGVALKGPPEGASLVAQTVKNLPAMQETQVQSLGGEDPLEEGDLLATHSSILAWRIPWTKETCRLQSTGLQKSQTQLSDLTLSLRGKGGQRGRCSGPVLDTLKIQEEETDCSGV